MALDPQYLDQIKQFEGYTPQATWDYKQNSVGYGTRARYPGEVIDRDEAERRFQSEIQSAADRVDAMGVPMTPGQRAALTSLTYNSGTKWMTSGLGDAVRAGDWDRASERLNMYVNAGGEQLPGLAARRAAESKWLRAPASQDASAQPSASSPASVAAAPSQPSRASSGDVTALLQSLGNDSGAPSAASTALRVASSISPKSQASDDPDLPSLKLNHNPQGIGGRSRGLEMAAASIPYARKRADGGGLDDTAANVPETYQSLLAQQRQLIEGRRPAQMFPVGTEELPLPPGMQRVVTPRGVFHFDPLRVTAKEIVAASQAGRENEILGLGPLSKDDVADVMSKTGEKPVVVTERDRGGNEVRGSLATPSTVPMQSDEILRTADPMNKVDVEPVDDVISQRALRLARAEGGSIGEGPDRREPELRQWNPPWYDRLPHAVTDLIYGENAGPKQGADVKHILGTDNPFNLPGNIQQGASRFTQGMIHGDTDQMLAGGVQAGMSALPALPAARATAAGISRGLNVPTKTRPIGPWDRDFNLESDFRASRPIEPMHEINKMPEPKPSAPTDSQIGAMDDALRREVARLTTPGWTDRGADMDIYYDVLKGKYLGTPRAREPGQTPRYLSKEDVDKIDETHGLIGGLSAKARAHGDLNENIPKVRDEAYDLARRIDEHDKSTREPLARYKTEYKNMHDVLGNPIEDGKGFITRYQRDARDRLGVDINRFHEFDVDDVANILKREYGADFTDRASIEKSYRRFIDDEVAAKKAGNPTHHDLRRFHAEREADDEAKIMDDMKRRGIDNVRDEWKGARAPNEAEIRDIERAYDAAPDNQKARMKSILDRAKAGRVNIEELQDVGEVLRNNTLRGKLEGFYDDHIGTIDPWRVGLYGSAVGAGGYVGHKTSTGEWSNPIRDVVNGVLNIEDQNVDAENQKGGFYGSGNDFPADRLRRAMTTKRASGGGISGANPLTGPLYGATGGRADKIPGTARSGSHVIPADIVSHMGQGNTNAGLKALEKMFTTGPYGMALSGRAAAKRLASGGGVGEIPVMLSDGEYVVEPEVVSAIGNGDLAAGHDALDQWIMHERQNAIKTLSELPPPATD